MINTKVKVYRNLNNGKFSIKTTKVIGYLDSLILRDVTFTGAHGKVQANIQAGAHRSVHAYAVGILTHTEAGKPSTENLIEVTYHPKIKAGFYIKDTGKEIHNAKKAVFIDGKMFCEI